MSRSRDLANLADEATGGITKAEVGLGNVDNTADSAKPVSTAQQTEIDKLAYQGEPHIIPRYLHPAIEGKSNTGVDLKALVTAGSYAWGDVYSGDNLRYFYTDIKGSKPIKDPRIGGHFGSQRHKFKSIQLLEQETATYGENVYSIDGREWIRGNVKQISNDNSGNYIDFTQDGFIEITGYWSSFNIIFYTATSTDQFKYQIDGATAVTSDLAISVGTPLHSRYVDAGSVHNLVTGQTLGIHTIKLIRDSSTYSNYFYGCELIAQDTTSTANRSKIQIPSQDVVSYGKKFTVSGTPHYDPFNGFTSGSSVSSYVDTATSLGLDKWLHSSTYYRPYNGMRVIKWVDENGTIKTSVTLMPPNAKSIADSSLLTNGTAKANASASNDTFYPTFEAHTTDVNEDNLHEVAKTFHVKEFGNGSANGGTNSGSFADASMLSGTSDNIAYVMDDGLTSLSGTNGGTSNNIGLNGIVHYDSDYAYFTFIGTGVSITGVNWSGSARYNLAIAQNLSYGTHIYKMDRNTSSTTKHFVDGVELSSVSQGSGHMISEITLHQPQKPPIPEDACVIADYMLMADFVKQTGTGSDIRGQISKGVRRVSGSRDVFCDDTGSRAFYDDNQDNVKLDVNNPIGFYTFASHASTQTSSAQLEFFGTDAIVHVQGSDQTHIVDFGGSTNVAKTALDNTSTNYGDVITLDNSATLGSNTVKTTVKQGGYVFFGYDVATPIHTSHHYQSFETPFLHELVGGDRNMEQTNLVCSPDGKTWDEVTRDTSYIGNVACQMTTDTATSWSSYVVFDEWRGVNNAQIWFNKYFAIAYDRLICLETGWYKFIAQNHSNNHGAYMSWNISSGGTEKDGFFLYQIGDESALNICQIGFCQRGDFVRLRGEFGNSNMKYSNASVEKLS